MAGMSSSFPGTVTSSAPCVAAAPGSRHSLPQGAPRLHCKGGNSSSSLSRLPVSALKSFHHYNIRLNHLRILWFPWKYTCQGHCTQTHTWGFENQISCQGRRIGRRRIRLLEHHSVSVPAGWFCCPVCVGNGGVLRFFCAWVLFEIFFKCSIFWRFARNF